MYAPTISLKYSFSVRSNLVRAAIPTNYFSWNYTDNKQTILSTRGHLLTQHQRFKMNQCVFIPCLFNCILVADIYGRCWWYNSVFMRYPPPSRADLKTHPLPSSFPFPSNFPSSSVLFGTFHFHLALWDFNPRLLIFKNCLLTTWQL